jgi:hypothetical protein
MVYREPNTDWVIVAVGDYDGDGRADILWRNIRPGEVCMMLMNGLTIASQGMVYSEPNTAWRPLGPFEYENEVILSLFSYSSTTPGTR